MKRLLVSAVALSSLALASAAWAETPGWYIGIGGGYSTSPDPDVGTHGNGTPPILQDHMTDGYAIDGNVGYSWGMFKAEGEFLYRDNSFNALDFPKHTAASGDFASYSGFFNGYWNITPNWSWTPYLGAGIGVTDISFGNWQAKPAGKAAVKLANNSSVTGAYQGIAGVNFYVNPNWSISAEYRIESLISDVTVPRTGQPGSNLRAEYIPQSGLLHLTYHFTSPPPMLAPPAPMPAAAPAPPPPAPPRTFLVFFDFDKSNLTVDARKVVEQAAQSFKANGVARIELTGYTDLAGTQAYNLRLSKRRAETVAGALEKMGVPKAAINVMWRGKENPRVPTPDGVREPQNRRVEIVMP